MSAEIQQELAKYLDKYLTSWEIGGNDPQWFPWNDPDGGELRIVMCLRKVITQTDHEDVMAIIRDAFEAPGINTRTPQN